MANLQGYFYYDLHRYDVTLSPTLQNLWDHFVVQARLEMNLLVGFSLPEPDVIDLEVAGPDWRVTINPIEIEGR